MPPAPASRQGFGGARAHAFRAENDPTSLQARALPLQDHLMPRIISSSACPAFQRP